MQLSEMADRVYHRCRVSEVNAYNGTACIEWQNATMADGYAQICIEKRFHKIHRITLASYLGRELDPILKVDHLCRNLICCNPLHLEEVTHITNVQRGFAGINHSSKTHCVNGHEFTKENTYYRKNNGCRQCRMCRNIQGRRYRHR